MDYVQGIKREQIILFPESVDDYIEEENPVKFIDAFVDGLDLVSLDFKYAKINPTGRPPYNPGDMLKLYVYGYLNNVRSSRRLEREAKRNVELMWLLRKLTPEYKTIANFRKDNLEAVKKTCRQFTLLCKNLDLFGAELVAIDGSKFRAVNSKKNNFTKSKLDKFIKAIDEKIQGYVTELDENDQVEDKTPDLPASEIKEKLKALKQRKGKYHQLLEEMDNSGATEISLTDPDSRLMMNNQKVEVCYNAQIAVDSKHKLIVEHEVINNPADQGQLSSLAIKTKETLEAKNIEVLADKGYYDARDIKACLDSGAKPFIPRPKRNNPKDDDLFNKASFKYDLKNDTYICPAGFNLVFSKLANDRGKSMRLYTGANCQNCALKTKCTKSKHRTVSRWEHEEVLEDMEKRVVANKEKIRQRQWLVEHPFGTLKRSSNQSYFLLRGLDKVRAEFSLSVLIYNLKRVIKIVGVKDLVAALAAA